MALHFSFVVDIITDTETMSLTFQQNLSQRYPEKFRVKDSRQGLLKAYDTVLKASLLWPSNFNKTTIRLKDGNVSFPPVVKMQEVNSSKSDNDKKQSLYHGDSDTRRRVRRAVTDDSSASTGEEPSPVSMGNGMHSDGIEETIASVFHGLSLFIVVVLLTEVTVIMTFICIDVVSQKRKAVCVISNLLLTVVVMVSHNHRPSPPLVYM
jgi:hypothetical protein